MSKRKHVHYDLPVSDSSDEDTPAGGTSQPPRANLTQMLRETSRVGVGGRLSHRSEFIPVVASPKKAAKQHLLRPDIAAPGPVYDLWETGGDGDAGIESDSDDEGRSLRDSDDRLRQWVQEYREEFLLFLLLLDGRGDFRSYSVCASCRSGKADHRCNDCMAGGELICKECIVSQHQSYPLHRVEYWDGHCFEKKLLKELGLRIQLGHWAERPRRCLVPRPAAGEAFVIVDEHGVHPVNLDFCGCGRGGADPIQLLAAQLYPATVAAPRTACTFNVLDRFQLLSFESKCSSYEFYHSLARESNNAGLKDVPNRYHEFRRVTREWNHLSMLKRAGMGNTNGGVAAAEPGSCALLCPACPHPGINLPDDWKDAPEEKKFLYALFLAMDANFRLKRKDVSSEAKDPGLGDGLSFYNRVQEYMTHVEQHWDKPQERSTCVAHDAVDKPDRDSRGTASSGIGAVDCARHNMKRPLAVGDLQLGERYINIDYMFFRSLVGTALVRFFVSYDIACQWHINIWNRMEWYDREIQMVDDAKFVVFLVPKFHLPAHIEACNLRFSFHLTRDVGQTDGEAPERGWANANPLAGSTKEMGPGARRDTLNEHFNDWNWKKIIAFGRVMLKKMRRAVPEMVATKIALEDMESSLAAAAASADEEVEAVEVWTEMAELWEKDPEQPNPFETLSKDDHVAKVRRELAEEAAARAEAGEEEEGAVVDEMHVTEMIAMGLQLEEQQRTLGFDVAGVGLHPTDDQTRVMVERTSKLRRKIEAWQRNQERFIPHVIHLRQKEDAARVLAARTQPVPGVQVQSIKLWMPSAMMKLPGARRRPHCTTEVQEYEYRLRVGQANEALHDMRRQLLVRSHMYKYKDKNTSGVRGNMRSKEKIDALNESIRRSAAQYRAARAALESLGKALERDGWKVTLRELKDEDVRGRPRSTFGDPDRQKAMKQAKGRGKGPKKKARKELPLSWIWVVQTGGVVAGEKQTTNEALRIEWAKTRARSLRWREEVDLLEEEMERIIRFLTWRAEWWEQRIGERGLEEGAQLEGETAFAVKQARIHKDLRDAFSIKWAALPDLVSKGREGVDVQGVDGDEWSDDEEQDEGGEADDSEAEPIPDSSAGRRVKSTYVDT